MNGMNRRQKVIGRRHQASAVLAVVTIYVDYLSWNPQVQQGDVLNEQALSIAADVRRSLCGGSWWWRRVEIILFARTGAGAVAAVALQLAAVSSPRRPTVRRPITNSENDKNQVKLSPETHRPGQHIGPILLDVMEDLLSEVHQLLHHQPIQVDNMKRIREHEDFRST